MTTNVDDEVAWIIGGGSGIGAACAKAVASSGMAVVISGRNESRLRKTASEIREAGGVAFVRPVDVIEPDSIALARDWIEASIGWCRVMVYCAGTNYPTRFWGDLTSTQFEDVVAANLSGAVRASEAVLPAMQGKHDGLLVMISSWAAWRHSPGAGVSYTASKTGLGAVCESLNAELGQVGIRATHFCPGEVDTEILKTRPNPPSDLERARMLRPEDVGSAVSWLAALPKTVCVNELVFTPTDNKNYAKRTEET